MAEQVEQWIGNRDGTETARVPFEIAQEISAARQFVVHDVEHLAIDSLHQSREGNGFGAVVHISQRNAISTAKMQEYPKSVDPDPRSELLTRARAENCPGSHGDNGYAVFSTHFLH